MLSNFKIPKFIENLFGHYIDEIKKQYNILKARSKDLMNSNIELCYFYIFNKNFADALFRIKMMEKFLSSNVDVKFCQAVALIFNNKIDAGKDLLKEIVGNHPNMEFAKFIYQAWNDNQTINSIPPAVIKEIYQLQAPFYHNLNDKENYFLAKKIVEISSNFGFTENTIVNVLDLGCCDGYFTQRIIKAFGSDYHITGVESNHKMMEAAKILEKRNRSKLYQNIFESGNIDYLKGTESKFEVILNMHHLKYENNLGEFLSICAHKLHKPGIVIFRVMFDKNVTQIMYNKQQNTMVYPHIEIDKFIKEHKYQILFQSSLADNGSISYVLKLA